MQVCRLLEEYKDDCDLALSSEEEPKESPGEGEEEPSKKKRGPKAEAKDIEGKDPARKKRKPSNVVGGFLPKQDSFDWEVKVQRDTIIAQLTEAEWQTGNIWIDVQEDHFATAQQLSIYKKALQARKLAKPEESMVWVNRVYS